MQVFDRTNGKLRRKVALPDHNLVANPALSRDGKQLAYALEKNSVRIYDCETGRETRRISQRGNWASGLAFAPDGKTIAVSDNTDTVCCYNVDNGKSVCELRHDRDVVSELVFSPDGQFFATVTNPKANQTFGAEISVWRTGREGKVIHRLKMPSGMVFHPAFSPDGKLLAASGFHEEILIWDVSTGKETRRYSARNGITSLVFSGDGKCLATMTGAGTIQLRETDTGILLPVSADSDIDFIHDFRFRAEGRQLIGLAGRYRAWDVQTGREISRFLAEPLRALRYDLRSDYLSPDESLFADADEEGTIHLRETATGREVHLLKGHTKTIACVTFSPDGRFLFSSSGDKIIRVWEVKSGHCRHELKDGGPRLRYMTASPDGRWLAATYDGSQPDQKLILWDLASGQQKARIPARGRGFLYQLAFSPDSRFLAAVGGGGRLDPGKVTLWTVPEGKLWRTLEGHELSALCLAYSADSRMVATGDYAGTLLLWEMASGRLRHSFKGHTSALFALTFSPNGRLLAAASSEAPAYLWDVIGSLEYKANALSADDLRHCWSNLRSDDAALAFQSIRHLAAVPAQTLPLLWQHLKPVPTPDPKQVRQLVEMLDSDDFPTRQKAAEELEKLADAAASLLRQIMAKEKPTLEVRRTLQQILEAVENKPETLRAVRAVEVLEWMATPDAVRLIGELAKGTAEARLTREASAAKRRLSH